MGEDGTDQLTSEVAGPGEPSAPPTAADPSPAPDEPERSPKRHLGERYQHLISALIATVAGAALVFGAAASAGALVAVVAVLQAALIGTWVATTGGPGRIGGLALGVAGAAAADVVVMVWPHGQLGSLVGVLAFVQIAAFLHQLLRGVARSEIVTSLGRTELMLIAVIAFSALVVLRNSNDGRALSVAVVLAAAGALVEGHLVDLAWIGPRFDSEVRRGVLAAVVSVLVSGAITYAWLDHEQVLDHQHALILGISVGVIASLFALCAAFVLANLSEADAPGTEEAESGGAESERAQWPRPFVAVLLPLALLAPIAYLLGSAVQG
jgi:hypothetical protein